MVSVQDPDPMGATGESCRPLGSRLSAPRLCLACASHVRVAETFEKKEKAQKTLNSAAMQFPLCKSFASLSQGREQPYLAMLSVGCVLDEAMRTIFYLDTVVDLRRSNLYEMAFHKH